MDWCSSSTATACGALPSPQSIVTTCVSSRPGSKKEPCTLTLRRPATMFADSAVIVGATLLTTSWNDVDELAPLLSVAVMTTVCDWRGPLPGGWDHGQVAREVVVMASTGTRKETGC